MSRHEFTKEYVEGNILKDPKTGCWRWTRFYGSRAPDKVRRGPHRLVYNLYRGVWLEANVFLIHTCGDIRCVNPDHMEERRSVGNPGAERDSESWGENGQYQFKRGLMNPKTRLTPLVVQTIKACLLCNFPPVMLAEHIGVDRSTIHAIRHGKTWAHVPWPDKPRAVRLATIWCRQEQIGVQLRRMEELAKEAENRQ